MIAEELAPGSALAGRYTVLRAVGHGGMGTVYEAYDQMLSRRVAVKLLHASGDDDVRTRRFENEARALAAIRSEHIVKVFDRGLTSPTPGARAAPFMVMEFLDGEDLSQVLDRRGRLPIAEAVDTLLEAMLALAQAHRAGIVHRDLKPANLFMSAEPDGTHRLKVLDFGVSKLAARGTAELMTASGTLLGTPAYMAPEQLRNSSNVDARTDIWALGIIACELMTGARPFKGPETIELFVAILEAPPRAIDPSVPAPLREVLLRCLEKEPARRYASVGELASALAPFGTKRSREYESRLDRLSAPSLGDETLDSGARLSVKSSVDDSDTMSAAEAPRRRSRLPRVRTRFARVALGACTALAVLATGVAFTVSRRQADENARQTASNRDVVLEHAPAPLPYTAPSATVSAAPATTGLVTIAAPGDVSVWLEGEPAVLSPNHQITVHGATGTKFTFTLQRQKEATNFTVVLTANGPLPSELRWPDAPGRVAPRAGPTPDARPAPPGSSSVSARTLPTGLAATPE